MDFGALVGICELTACFPARAIRDKSSAAVLGTCRSRPRRRALLLDLGTRRPLPAPIVMAGQQRFFDVDEGVVVASLQAMAAAGTIDPERAVRWLAGV